MENGQEQERWVGYVDWRNRPAFRGKHGGMFAASFVLVVEVMENLAFLANASNLVTYLMGFMHFSPSHSATTVTNFMGTAFLLALLGGFLSDAFFTTYVVYLVSALIEFLGLVILTIQAKSPSLKPPACEPSSPSRAAGPCEAVSGAEAAMLFGGLYLTALGVGGIKARSGARGGAVRRGLAAGPRRAVHLLQLLRLLPLLRGARRGHLRRLGRGQQGLGVGVRDLHHRHLAIHPVFSPARGFTGTSSHGSPLTLIAKVLVAAALNCRTTQPPSNAIVDRPLSPENRTETNDHKQEERENGDHKNTTISYAPSEELKFLNRAAQNLPRHLPLACTAEEVEEVKVVLKILPIFLSTIMLNCCLAQLSTFSVEQAATMDTRVGRLTVPPASLPIFPVTFIMILAPVYDHIVLPFARRVTKTEVGITHLQRIGTGLVLSIVSMAIAALVEVKRKNVAQNAGLVDSLEPLPISFFWIALQYLFLGSADLFTLAGLLEFFFSEAPARMRSLATALSWASLAMGYYLSSVLVSIVNSATGRGSHWPWLKGSNLNHYRLERFYWLMCVLSSLNYLFYLFWALRYKYRRGGVRG
ncbi:Protein NRT1/ PTR FAMILY 4.6 [Ananas comosus]|uniref:Protein NRT1/ PTR FAMILY 4.6 n=1 Tax=Ananas comosus TaxID=4615 RepID=A0A199WA62_ANACO|nr:Protein NRT1/ PTR FAMILY 4.6 [Ananas comosus]